MRDLITGALVIILSTQLITFAILINQAPTGIDLVIPAQTMNVSQVETYYVYVKDDYVVLVDAPNPPYPDYAAVIEAWPGGYRCLNTSTVIHMGPNPYEGFWCPPPWQTGNMSVTVNQSCRLIGQRSLGRILVLAYTCR